MVQHDLQQAAGREPTVVGSSAALVRVFSRATHAAAHGVKVAITGESGVGKDVLARFIHAHSPRASMPFVPLNCAGVTETLLESELFGHVRGSFTGAYRDKIGCLQLAHQGTVFLDEIGDMGQRMQALLLRFLETGEIRRVGSETSTMHADVRIISATNRDLRRMVRNGEFREDLYYRINVVHLHIPPLRERIEDIPPLLHHMANRTSHGLAFSDDAMRALVTYDWPGNVRELQNVVEQLASTVRGGRVELGDLQSILDDSPRHSHDRDRRRSVVNELYDELTTGNIRFWEDVHRLFMNRDLTRTDLRQLIRQGLATCSGSYRGLLRHFGMSQSDYKPLLNFLATHDCRVDSRAYRPGASRRSGWARPDSLLDDAPASPSSGRRSTASRR